MTQCQNGLNGQQNKSIMATTLEDKDKLSTTNNAGTATIENGVINITPSWKKVEQGEGGSENKGKRKPGVSLSTQVSPPPVQVGTDGTIDTTTTNSSATTTQNSNTYSSGTQNTDQLGASTGKTTNDQHSESGKQLNPDWYEKLPQEMKDRMNKNEYADAFFRSYGINPPVEDAEEKKRIAREGLWQALGDTLRLTSEGIFASKGATIFNKDNSKSYQELNNRRQMLENIYKQELARYQQGLLNAQNLDKQRKEKLYDTLLNLFGYKEVSDKHDDGTKNEVTANRTKSSETNNSRTSSSGTHNESSTRQEPHKEYMPGVNGFQSIPTTTVNQPTGYKPKTR